jgi:hypothetical protein
MYIYLQLRFTLLHPPKIPTSSQHSAKHSKDNATDAMTLEELGCCKQIFE